MCSECHRFRLSVTRFMTLVRGILFFDFFFLIFCWVVVMMHKWNVWLIFDRVWYMWTVDGLNTGKRKCNILNWILSYFFNFICRVSFYFLCIQCNLRPFRKVRFILNGGGREREVEEVVEVVVFLFVVTCYIQSWTKVYDLMLLLFQGLFSSQHSYCHALFG